ncbi:MAG: response regulator [Bdellovibrionales bacterium]|nr:response regulator [Bdellovibrionales bacterium]MBT3527094.1 response regulator [Bdellovibrionales bacterium]MBT7669801.1 response regulator [Bdellovibrionales bacterium]MBT7767920.1 response regulator [Bdellovibrionales bacterium]
MAKEYNETELKMDIMVVDDSDFSRKGIVEILSANGYEVSAEANSVSSALIASRRTPCDLYIVDVVMPKASGIEFVKALNNNTQENNFVIMISSLMLDSIVVESITNGAVDFLQKPFKSDELLASLERVERLFRQQSHGKRGNR